MRPYLRLALPLCFTAFFAMTLSLAFAADSKSAKKTEPTPTPAPAPTPTPAPSVNIRVDLLMVSMPEEKFITLLPDLLDKDKIEKAVPDLLDAVKSKSMILEGYLVITTKSGQRAVAETVKEVRYPTEPAGNAPVTSANPGQAQPAPADASTPMDYDTRNTGATLEVEPIASPDGQSIDLNLAPQEVQLLGFLNTPEPGKNAAPPSAEAPKPVTVTQSPLFYTMKDTTSITLRNGRHMLFGVHKTAQPEGNIEVFIVHAEILPNDK